MYYINARYYNADWGRFINADGYVGEIGTLLSFNMFAYCVNNPVNLYDPSGRWFTLTQPVVWKIAAAVVSTVTTIASSPVIIGIALVAATGLVVYTGYNYYKSIAKSEGSKPDSKDKGYEDSKSKGVPAKDHTVVPHNPNPKASDKNLDEGKPNSSSDLLNPDGSVKQRRYFGTNGKPELDIDFNHSGKETHTFPHTHKWDWSQPKPRLKWEPMK